MYYSVFLPTQSLTNAFFSGPGAEYFTGNREKSVSWCECYIKARAEVGSVKRGPC